MLRRLTVIFLIAFPLACSSEIVSDRHGHPADQPSELEPPDTPVPSPKPSASPKATPSPTATPKKTRGSTLNELRERIPYIEALSTDHNDFYEYVEGKSYLNIALAAAETTATRLLKLSAKPFLCTTETGMHEYLPTEKGAIETRTTLDAEGAVLNTYRSVTEGENVTETWSDSRVKRKKCTPELCEYAEREPGNDEFVLTQKEVKKTSGGIQTLNREIYNKSSGLLEVKMEERCKPLPWGDCQLLGLIRQEIGESGEVTRTLTNTYIDRFLIENSTVEYTTGPIKKVHTRNNYKYDEKSGTEINERYESVDNQPEEASVSLKYFALVNGKDTIGHYATQAKDRNLLSHKCSHDPKRKAIVRCYVALEPTDGASFKKLEVSSDHLIVAVKLDDGSYRPAAIRLRLETTTEYADMIAKSQEIVELRPDNKPTKFSVTSQKTTLEDGAELVPLKNQEFLYEYDNAGRLIKISSSTSSDGDAPTESFLDMSYGPDNQALTLNISGKASRQCEQK